MKKLFVIVAVILGFYTPSYGQAQPGENPFPYNGPSTGDIAGAVVSALFGGGGELPVRDADVRAKEAIEVIKQTAMLIDMLFNSEGGASPNDPFARILLARLRQLSEQSYPHLYGKPPGAIWNDTHALTHQYTEGGWLPNEIDRGKRTAITYREIMQMLYERKAQWEQNAQAIDVANEVIASSEGRNATLKAISGSLGIANEQTQITQALLMALVNANAVHFAQVDNEKIATESQQYYFVSNGGHPEEGGGRELPWPTFRDVGLR